jgi:guanylate kinase
MTNLYIISAPSGSGKSTLVGKVRDIVPRLDFSISYTTRPPRGNERNGVEYFFVSQEEFDRMVKRGEFLESAEVFGNCYGTAKRFLDEAQRKGYDLLLDIDVQGAAQIKNKIPGAISIFILPPDRKTLEARLRHRSLDKEDVIHRRLVTASREIEKYREYDYILINDRLEDSVEALKAILLSERLKDAGCSDAGMLAIAERCRLSNVGERLQPILASFASAVMPGGR